MPKSYLFHLFIISQFAVNLQIQNELVCFYSSIENEKKMFSLQKQEDAIFLQLLAFFLNEQFNDTYILMLPSTFANASVKSYMDALPQCQHRFV